MGISPHYVSSGLRNRMTTPFPRLVNPLGIRSLYSASRRTVIAILQQLRFGTDHGPLRWGLVALLNHPRSGGLALKEMECTRWLLSQLESLAAGGRAENSSCTLAGRSS